MKIKVKCFKHDDCFGTKTMWLGYTGKLTDKVSFKENIVVLYSKDRTMKRATSSLNYAVTDNVSIALSHEITHRNKIANTATDKNDDATKLKIIVKF